MASSESTVVSIKELPREAQCVMQTMAAIELFGAQREVAKYLEWAYLKLNYMPDVAREVRMTANNARTQHLMSTGLIKKFTVTAGQIVGTMIPMILDAIELEDSDIVVACFNQIIDMADNMKKEAEETQKNYHLLQDQVQKNFATLNEKNKHIMDEEKKRAIEMEREQELLKAAKFKEKQLEDEKRKMDEELETLQEHRDQMMEASEKALDDDDEKTFLGDAIAPGSAFGAGLENIFGVLQKGVNIFKSIFGIKKDLTRIKTTQEAFQKSQALVEKTLDKNKHVVERLYAERVDALNRLAKIKELALAEVGIGNSESLREASARLGDVDKLFTRIIQFWSSMTSILLHLKNDTNAGKAYLKKIENPNNAEKLKKYVAGSEKGWTNFRRICSDYIEESDAEINTLYAFLSAPIDQMTAAERKQREKELMLEIADDINNRYPQEYAENVQIFNT